MAVGQVRTRAWEQQTGDYPSCAIEHQTPRDSIDQAMRKWTGGTDPLGHRAFPPWRPPAEEIGELHVNANHDRASEHSAHANVQSPQ
jgi:hypothetical protein